MSSAGGEPGRHRVSSLWLWLLVVLVGYLVFRLVQGAMWLIQRV